MSQVKLSKECVENALKISGYSKYRLAKESGKPLRTIQRWFNTDLRIDQEELFKLCLIIDIEPAYLEMPAEETVVDPDGFEYVPIGYHDYYRLSKKTISTLPEEKRKRVDPNGVYVEHFTKEKMLIYKRFRAHWDCKGILKQYILETINHNLVKNSDFIKNNPDLIDKLTWEVDEIAKEAIEKTIRDLMLTECDGKEEQ